jgi:LacI family purine nucleotide synthesis repressor
MVSLKDVAEKAKVSTMTVSRVINNPAVVNQRTREAVRDAIDKLNYIPNKLAKSLAEASSKTVGVLYSNIFNQVYSSIIAGIEESSRQNDYNVIISNVIDLDSGIKGLEMLLSKMIDGLIVLPFEPIGMATENQSNSAIDEMNKFYEHLRNQLKIRQVPCIIIDIDVDDCPARFVKHDYEKAAELGIKHLIGEGYKDIYFINSKINEGLWADREAIYCKVMGDSGLSENIRIGRCVHTPQGAFKTVSKILETEKIPKVFYCANDVIAMGAIQAISAKGLKIPQDVAVMGNDGIFSGEMIVPKLSTVSINSLELGKKAMEDCLSIIHNITPEGSVFVSPFISPDRESI